MCLYVRPGFNRGQFGRRPGFAPVDVPPYLGTRHVGPLGRGEWSSKSGNSDERPGWGGSKRCFSEAILIFRGCSPREHIPKNDAITSKDLLHFPRPMIFGIYIMILSGYSNYSTWIITSVYPQPRMPVTNEVFFIGIPEPKNGLNNPGGDPWSAWGPPKDRV